MFMKNFGEFYNNQVEYAKTIVMSRTQNMKDEKIEEAVKLLREKNEDAAIITTPWDDLDGSTDSCHNGTEDFFSRPVI